MNQTRNRFLPAYNDIPTRDRERDDDVTRGMGTTSGSINNGTYFNNDNLQLAGLGVVRDRQSQRQDRLRRQVLMSYQRPQFNDLQMNYAYATPR